MSINVKLKKMYVHVNFRAKDDNSLEVDFGALDLSTPHLTLPSSIGNGMQFVSKFMSSKLSGKPESMKPLLDYLLALNYRGEVRMSVIHTTEIIKVSRIRYWLDLYILINMQKLMVNDTIDTVEKLQTALLLAEVFVSGLPRYTPYLKFEQR
jgi:sucrose synthase